MTQRLERLNSLSAQQAEAELLDCCGAKNWAQRMARARPFRDTAELFEAADRTWRELSPQEWLEAFGRHPRIGERASKEGSSQAQRWSRKEQSGASAASERLRGALAEANRAYEARFGYIFIVCATGKSAEEMLALLRQRLQNDPSSELHIAAEEQRKITRLRLEKLLKP